MPLGAPPLQQCPARGTSTPSRRNRARLDDGRDEGRSIEDGLLLALFEQWHHGKAVRAGATVCSHSLVLAHRLHSLLLVQLELRTAIELEKKIVLVHEDDARHGRFNFASEKAAAPEDLRFVLEDSRLVRVGGGVFAPGAFVGSGGK